MATKSTQKKREAEERKEKKLQAELLRLKTLMEYEELYRDRIHIAGIDEAGRGPLAGPVVAAAVVLPKDAVILYLNDSKKVSEKKRESLYEEIIEKAVAVGVGIVPPSVIDEINILQATYLAMKKAIEELEIKPDILLNDAVTIPDILIEQVPIIKGDAKSVSIAAASIIAKVTRDRMMRGYDQLYPDYGFASHKGYGTKVHIEAIKAHGICPIHRHSFLTSIIDSIETA